MLVRPCPAASVFASSWAAASGGASSAPYPRVRVASAATPRSTRVTRSPASAGRAGSPTASNWVGSGARSRARSVNCRADQGRLTGSAVPQPTGAAPVSVCQAVSRARPSTRFSSALCTVRNATISCRSEVSAGALNASATTAPPEASRAGANVPSCQRSTAPESPS